MHLFTFPCAFISLSLPLFCQLLLPYCVHLFLVSSLISLSIYTTLFLSLFQKSFVSLSLSHVLSFVYHFMFFLVLTRFPPFYDYGLFWFNVVCLCFSLRLPWTLITIPPNKTNITLVSCFLSHRTTRYRTTILFITNFS